MQSTPIQVTINGEAKTVPFGQSVADLLSWLAVSPDRVAVEVDKSLIRKRDWDQTAIPSGCQIEIVEFVGGG